MRYIAALFLLVAFFPVKALSNGETLSPNMGLPVPAVGVTTGPAWAQDVNASLGIIDSHNHCSGSGVQITPCGLDINADLTFLGNNATNLNSAVFLTNVGTPSNLSIYTNGTDLFYKNASGTPIQMTANGGVNVSAGNIQNLPSTPSGGAGISWQNSQGTFQLLKDSGTVGANLDGGALIVRYGGSYPTPSGNYTAIQANASLSTGFAFTLPATLPSATSALMVATSGAMSYQTPDAIAQSMTSTGANAIAATMTSTGANSIGSTMTSTGANAVANSRTRATGTSVGAGGVAISTSSGAFTTTSTTFVDVTNLSVTIITRGRPVFIGLQPDGTSNFSAIQAGSTGTNAEINFGIVRTPSGSRVANSFLQVVGNSPSTTNTSGVPPGSVYFIDTPAAGTYTYKLQVNGLGGAATNTVTIDYCVLVAYEL